MFSFGIQLQERPVFGKIANSTWRYNFSHVGYFSLHFCRIFLSSSGCDPNMWYWTSVLLFRSYESSIYYKRIIFRKTKISYPNAPKKSIKDFNKKKRFLSHGIKMLIFSSTLRTEWMISYGKFFVYKIWP